MPRAKCSSSISDARTTAGQYPSISFRSHSRSSASLRRNQACRQCRKRKSKCDAGRPCKACLRAHAVVVAGLVKRGLPLDSVQPDCVYDGDHDHVSPTRSATSPSRLTTSPVQLTPSPSLYSTSPSQLSTELQELPYVSTHQDALYKTEGLNYDLFSQGSFLDLSLDSGVPRHPTAPLSAPRLAPIQPYRTMPVQPYSLPGCGPYTQLTSQLLHHDPAHLWLYSGLEPSYAFPNTF